MHLYLCTWGSMVVLLVCSDVFFFIRNGITQYVLFHPWVFSPISLGVFSTLVLIAVHRSFLLPGGIPECGSINVYLAIPHVMGF